MTAPDWEDMADWSGLPEVYLTKVQRQQGMFWRIEACSVPMAIGPEVPLVVRDPAVLAALPEVKAMVAAAVREALEGAAVKPLVWDDNGKADVYQVTFANGQGPKAFLVARGSKIIGWYDDPDAAKAAAQADYTARILSALKGTP
jgi:hypothetical protein